MMDLLNLFYYDKKKVIQDNWIIKSIKECLQKKDTQLYKKYQRMKISDWRKRIVC